MGNRRELAVQRRDEWLQRRGRRSWNAVGLAAAAGIVHVAIAGGAVFGLLGAALSTPLVAIGVKVSTRLGDDRKRDEVPDA